MLHEFCLKDSPRDTHTPTHSGRSAMTKRAEKEENANYKRGKYIRCEKDKGQGPGPLNEPGPKSGS